MPELLLEIFSEEIPARMQVGAAEQLKQLAEKRFAEEGLKFKAVETYVTPRRLTLVAYDLPEKIESKTTEKRGPRLNAPQAALDGFLKSSGLKLEQLEKRDEFYFAVIKEEGKNTKDVLTKVLTEIIGGFIWPKSMRWGRGEKTWVRPLKSIICIFNGDELAVEFEGVKAGSITEGHRFLGKGDLKLKNFADYQKQLADNSVILSTEERKKIILEQAEKVALEKGCKLKKDEKLLEEVAGLVEWPVVLVGNIDQQFMSVPGEVLSTSMKAHQKYFSMLTNDGKLAPHFVVVSNMKASDGGKAIIAGNERVLRARLSDAKFFWEQDQKREFSVMLDKLSSVTFHAKLGTYKDKTNNIIEIARYVANATKVDVADAVAAAQYSKADLVSEMVGEFPELQGIMGGYYAEKAKNKKEVCEAIREHYYYPAVYDYDGAVTKKPLSLTVAIADKIDTLAGMFAIGEEPTGSKDPFALRRAALSIIDMILSTKIKGLKISELAGVALKLQKNSGKDTAAKIYQFFIERLKQQLKNNVRHDYVDAVLSGGEDDLLKLTQKAESLKEFLSSEAGNNLIAAYRRAANIIAAEEKKDKTSFAKQNVDKAIASAPEEKVLIEAIEKIQKSGIEEDLNDWKFKEAMQKLSELRVPVDNFFEKVIVNADDKAVRANRLGILYSLKNLMEKIADFSKIEK